MLMSTITSMAKRRCDRPTRNEIRGQPACLLYEEAVAGTISWRVADGQRFPQASRKPETRELYHSIEGHIHEGPTDRGEC